jgi:hypothetical protein
MIIWIKQSGLEIETNDTQASIARAESLGWKRKRKTPAKAPPKKPTEKAE